MSLVSLSPLIPPPPPLLPLSVRANGSSGPEPVSSLVARLRCPQLSLFFSSKQTNKQTKSYSLPPLFRFHSGSFSTPVLSQRAVYLVKRYTAAKLSRLAQKNQSPKPRYVCAGCTLHSTFSVSSLIQLPTTVRAWEKRSLNCPLPFGTIKIKSPSMLLRLYCAVVTAFPGF